MNATSSETKPRLLVVDDEPLVGAMIARLMRRHYDVIAVSSGREALDLATSQDWDAILCDIMMPELSGPEFLRRLSDEREELVPRTGFMTGGAFDKQTRTLLAEYQDRGWLSKPFRFREVQDFVDKLREAGRS